MRSISIFGPALAAAVLVAAPGAEAAAWCSRDTRGATNCGWYTYAQCQANISGIGGFCEPNFMEYPGAFYGSRARGYDAAPPYVERRAYRQRRVRRHRDR
jgi:hypothetical protein